MNFPDYYDILGLPRFYPTQEEIRDAFLKKVVALNASGEVNPDARQMLDSAYVTLSDTQKKREYDEILDNQIQAEKDMDSQAQEFPNVTAIHYLQPNEPSDDSTRPAISIQYDWHSPDKSKRCWSIDPESDKVYDFLFTKAEKLYQIICRYPFQDEITLDFNGIMECSMLFLYSSYFDVYGENYAEDEIKRAMEDGLLLLALYPPAEDSVYPYYPVNYSDEKNQRIISDFMSITDEILRAAQIAAYMRESLFNAIASVYIVHVFDRDIILQKAVAPDSEEAYQAMKRELREFWERFYTAKEVVT